MSKDLDSLKQHAHDDSKGLIRRLTLGVSSQFLVIISLIIRNIIVVPFFISAHQVVGYADWIKLLSLAIICLFVTFGQHFFYNYRIRTCRAERDYVGLNRNLAEANSFFLSIYVVLSIILTLMLNVVDLAALLNLEATGRTEAAWVFSLLLASMVGQAYRDTLRGVYMAYGELTRSEVIQALAHVLLGLLVILALLLKAPLFVIAVIYVLIVPGLVCTAAILDFRRYQEVVVALSRELKWPSRARLRSVASHTVPQFAERGLMSGPLVLLGLFGVGSDTVAQYNLARTANGLLRARPIAMVFSVELSRQRTQRDWIGFRRLYLRGALVMGMVGGGLVGGMMGLWDLFLPIWTNGAMTADMVLLGFMVLETALIAFGEHSAALLRFGGRMGDVARCQFGAAAFFVVFGIPALALGGVYPMLAVLVLSAALFLFLLPVWYAHRNMNTSGTVGLFLPLATGTAAAGITYGGLQTLRVMIGL